MTARYTCRQLAQTVARPAVALCGLVLALGLLAGCGVPLARPADTNAAQAPTAVVVTPAPDAPTDAPTDTPTPVPPTPTLIPSPTPTPLPQVFVGAGDIADCDSDGA